MLNDSEIKRAITVGYFVSDDGKPVAQKLDADNLWIELTEGGTACWRFRYIRPINARPTRMSVGVYPSTGLQLARRNAQAQRDLLAEGKDPVDARRNARNAARATRTFKEVIEEWFAAFREHATNRSKKTRENDVRARDQLVALFGKLWIAKITTAEIQDALVAVANKDGHKAKARRLRAMLRDVFKYAMPRKYCTENPAAFVDLPSISEDKLAAIIAPREVGELMRRIRGYDGRVLVRAALEVMARTFPRPFNVAAMEWCEIVGEVWIIPAHKMKMARQHRVPLSPQVLAILDELRPLTNPDGKGRYVFSTRNVPMATKTLNRALRKLGYTEDQHVAHGFRSTASTLLNNEYRWPSDLIELQLAHGDEDKVRAAYNRLAELEALMADKHSEDTLDRQWAVRVKMVHHWSNRLDALRDDDGTSNVVPLKLAA